MAVAFSSASPQEKYDVFLSFRGEDTRHNFTSHLYAALCEKHIKTFIDDKELKIGDQISPSLLNAIEQSKISLTIFSKGYASSTWCLEELVKILECMDKYGQIVIPIFYNIDPSDVRNQYGTFGDAFAKHEERFKGRKEMLQRWRTALREAANLSGFDSNVIRPESKLVQKVVKAVLMRLNDDSPLIDEDLVGVDSRIEDIERLLRIELTSVRKIGIWGAGGIGKTTLAKVVFNKIFENRRFERSFFFENIREESEKSKGLIGLQQQIICKILRDEDAKIGSTLTIRRLGCMKVFIVLDDVTNLKQIESVIGDFKCLGLGSRIIITTRDKQVLKKCHVDDIYETKILSSDAARQLFSRHAFRQECPPKDFRELAEKVLSYANGVPLALKALGSSLLERTKKEWENYIKRLSKIPEKDIQDILKVSYDGLNIEERAVFLDIACFFKGYDRDLIEAILDGCGFASHFDINVLIERSLITASFNTITMHDLLQEMGREIVRQESIDDPRSRSRLWDNEDILKVLTRNKGTEVIRSIRLDMSKVSMLHLKPKAFKNMQNLKFLEVYGCKHDEEVFGLEVLESDSCLLCPNIYFEKNSSKHEKKLHGFEVLKSNFSELRYLCWHGYSANSLPQNLNPKNLVALCMRYSKVKQLWNGDQKLYKLKHIDLSYSKHLLTMPDLSLIPNLESLILEGCTNLCESFNSVCNLNKLVLLNLRECRSFEKLEISTESKCLREVILSDCSDLEMVSFVPCTVEVLLLDGTAIKELPSLEHLFGLIKLSLKNCSRLESLPEDIYKLNSLRYLYLSGCSKLDRLPNGLGNLKVLEELEVEGLNLRDIRWSMKCLNNKTLSFSRCRIQEPWSFLKIHLPVFYNLTTLNLSNCRIEELPNNLENLSSLAKLYLGGNNFDTLPESIKDLHRLSLLDVSNCQKLKSLPELPNELSEINAQDCTSLEALSGLPTPGQGEWAYLHINFTDCFNLKFHALRDLTNALDNFERIVIEKEFRAPWASIYYPGSEIPTWFSYRSTDYFIKLPAGWLSDNLIGFVLCAVVSFPDDQQPGASGVIFYLVVNGKYVSCGYLYAHDVLEVIESYHVCVGYDYKIMPCELLTLDLNSEAYIEFFVENMWMQEQWNQFRPVEKCGVKLLYAEDNELRRDAIVERDQRLNSINCSVDDCLTCCLGYCYKHDKFDDKTRFSETLDRWSPHSEVYKYPAPYVVNKYYWNGSELVEVEEVDRSLIKTKKRRLLGQSDG